MEENSPLPWLSAAESYFTRAEGALEAGTWAEQLKNSTKPVYAPPFSKQAQVVQTII